MPNPGDVYLGLKGSEIALTSAGRRVSENDLEFARENRTADKTLVSDLVATKLQVSIAYELLRGADLEAILSLYNLHSDLNLILYDRDGSERSYTVKLRPLRRDRVTVLGGWIWAGVTLELEEV
jgi:hypothetical protein